MSMLCFILLAVYLGECSGETHFIYTTQEKEEKLKCGTNKWQISTKSDILIDLSCSVQCKPGVEVDIYDLEKSSFCSKDEDSQSRSVCSLEVKKSGYYSCVKSLDSGFVLFPFKSSPNNVIQSYIIAVQNSALTLESERRSSVNVAEGGSVTLNCSFSFKPGDNKNPFTVYWIKTVEQSSTCIYSYDKDGLNHHCDEQKKLGVRLLNLTTDRLIHNIKISGVKMSDSGQYRCALQMDTSVKPSKSVVNWKVIEDVTLSVRNPTPPHSTDQPETSETHETSTIPEEPTETTKTPDKATDGLLVGVYVGVSVLLLVLLAGVVVFIRKRRFHSAGCQTLQQQRNQEEAPDSDCSPYAVGRGDQYEYIKPPSKTADPDHEQSSEPLDPYSVVRLNDLYDSSASENIQHPV